MPSVTLVEPAGVVSSARPSASHEVVKRPSVVAASVSRARKANTVATSSSGKTKLASSSPTSRCSPTEIQPIAWQANSSIPIPKEKNPSGRPLPIGRSMILVWSWCRRPSALILVGVFRATALGKRR
jgi:hypothetical protein